MDQPEALTGQGKHAPRLGGEGPLAWTLTPWDLVLVQEQIIPVLAFSLETWLARLLLLTVTEKRLSVICCL